MPPYTRADTKGPKRVPTPVRSGPVTRQSVERDSVRSREVTPQPTATRKSTRKKPIRPAIPVQQSFAYGSPGRVLLPGQLDATIQEVPIVDAIEGAINFSGKPGSEPPEVQARDMMEKSKIGRTQPQRDEEGYQESFSFRTEDALGNAAAFSPLSEVEEEEEEENVQDRDDELDELRSNYRNPKLDEGIGRSNKKAPTLGEEHDLDGRPTMERRSSLVPDRSTSANAFLKSAKDALLVPLILLLLCATVLYTTSHGNRILPSMNISEEFSQFTRRTNIIESRIDSLTSLTRNQYNNLRDRVSSIELSYNKLANSLNVPQQQRRVNYFATGTGVLVNPYLTSPTKQLGRRAPGLGFLTSLTRFPAVTPPGPSTVFRPWDDIGDCWCAANADGKAQIAILLSRWIIPQDLIIEHIPVGATHDPGATPRDLELWVQILDAEKREIITNAALSILPPATESIASDAPSAASGVIGPRRNLALDETWVRVAVWQYNVHLASNVQSFPVSVPLDHFNVPVNKVVLRSLRNWGDTDHVCFYRLKMHGLLAQGENVTSTIID